MGLLAYFLFLVVGIDVLVHFKGWEGSWQRRRGGIWLTELFIDVHNVKNRVQLWGECLQVGVKEGKGDGFNMVHKEDILCFGHNIKLELLSNNMKAHNSINTTTTQDLASKDTQTKHIPLNTDLACARRLHFTDNVFLGALDFNKVIWAAVLQDFIVFIKDQIWSTRKKCVSFFFLNKLKRATKTYA